MSVLVTGGAGYIGSHAVYALIDRGETVVVIDNLSTGSRQLVSEGAFFVEGDIADTPLIQEVLEDHAIDAVLHFAASTVVPESVADPIKYYRNNTSSSCIFLDTCARRGVKKVIFSSTAAVYGNGSEKPISEDAPLLPINPYGQSKLMVEQILLDASRAGALDYIALRYFNVAGADPHGRTGQSNPKATHLIKRACEAAHGRIDALEIFGTDYPTPDGTGVRDYIHVTDLVDSHLLALDLLRTTTRSAVYNVGYGHGVSVREVVDVVESIAGRPLQVRVAPRRSGDPASIVADASRLKSQLGWEPKHDSLADMVLSAYEWEGRLRT